MQPYSQEANSQRPAVSRGYRRRGSHQPRTLSVVVVTKKRKPNQKRASVNRALQKSSKPQLHAMAMTMRRRILAIPRPRFLHMPFRSVSAPSAIIPTAIACSPSTTTIIRIRIPITSNPFCSCALPVHGVAVNWGFSRLET